VWETAQGLCGCVFHARTMYHVAMFSSASSSHADYLSSVDAATALQYMHCIETLPQPCRTSSGPLPMGRSLTSRNSSRRG